MIEYPDHLTKYEKATLRRASNIIKRNCLARNDLITNTEQAREYLKMRFSLSINEVFLIIFLTNHNHFIADKIVSVGTIDGAAVYPRTVIAEALKHNAAAVIFAHNHPSGVAEPTNADIAITTKLKTALSTIEVRVLDHFVVSSGEVVSMASRGLV